MKYLPLYSRPGKDSKPSGHLIPWPKPYWWTWSKNAQNWSKIGPKLVQNVINQPRDIQNQSNCRSYPQNPTHDHTLELTFKILLLVPKPVPRSHKNFHICCIVPRIVQNIQRQKCGAIIEICLHQSLFKFCAQKLPLQRLSLRYSLNVKSFNSVSWMFQWCFRNV